MLTTILSSVPLWVAPLLLGLLLIGARAARDRSAPVLLIYALPLLGLLSLGTARGMEQAGPALAALALFYVLGALIGFALQKRWTLGRSLKRVELRGEWLTMVTVLGLFVMNFAVGMISGMAPQIAGGAGFALGYGALAGLLSGSLAGRALRIALTPIDA